MSKTEPTPRHEHAGGRTDGNGRTEVEGRPDGHGHAEGHDGGHGHSVAAWTAVCVCLVGFLVMSIAVVASLVWLFVVGSVVVLVGGILGKVLSAMGFGASGRDREAGGVR